MTYDFEKDVPKNCPICNSPFLNSFNPNLYSGTTDLIKTCDLRIDHNCSYCLSPSLNGEHDKLGTFTIIYNNHRFLWVYDIRQVYVFNQGELIINCPWFIPKFENKKKLFNKLKSILIFS